jgi:hypothetical protein
VLVCMVCAHKAHLVSDTGVAAVRRYFTPGEYIPILPFESGVLCASCAHTSKNERSARRSSKLGSVIAYKSTTGIADPQRMKQC